MKSFRLLHSHLKVLSYNDLNNTIFMGGFERAFASLFDQDVQTFKCTMLLNLDQLEKQLDKEEFQEIGSFNAFRVLMTQFQAFINSELEFYYDEGLMICKYFLVYTRIEVRQFRDTLIQHMESVQKSIDERAQLKRYSGTESGKQDTSSTSGNYLTHVVDADIRLFVGNSDLKAQIQEKVFENVALKNELRKLKGNSVDTKFAKASILGKPPLQPSQNHFSCIETEWVLMLRRPRISKPRFASQVDEKNILSKPVTPHYLPNVRESAPAKSHHVNAPSSSRNSPKDSYGSNDMAYNYFLEEARKKTQDRNRNLKPREMPSARTHHTPNACTPRPRSNNQTFRNWPTSKSSNVNCIFNANHDACVTKFLNEVNSRVRKPSHKTRTRYKPVEKTSNTKKSLGQILAGHMFSTTKSFALQKKTNNSRSCLRWKPTSRIFKTVGLSWVPTGKIFTDSTTKVDSEPPNGSNNDITNPYECDLLIKYNA
ncbi:hypothetical protein Tco_0565927 [Tanacetum coccineum]